MTGVCGLAQQVEGTLPSGLCPAGLWGALPESWPLPGGACPNLWPSGCPGVAAPVHVTSGTSWATELLRLAPWGSLSQVPVEARAGAQDPLASAAGMTPGCVDRRGPGVGAFFSRLGQLCSAGQSHTHCSPGWPGIHGGPPASAPRSAG